MANFKQNLSFVALKKKIAKFCPYGLIHFTSPYFRHAVQRPYPKNYSNQQTSTRFHSKWHYRSFHCPSLANFTHHNLAVVHTVWKIDRLDLCLLSSKLCSAGLALCLLWKALQGGFTSHAKPTLVTTCEFDFSKCQAFSNKQIHLSLRLHFCPTILLESTQLFRDPSA